MKQLTAIAFFFVFVLNLYSNNPTQSYLIENDISKVGANIVGGTADNLYLALENNIYHKNGLAGEWELIYSLPRTNHFVFDYMLSPYELKFFKDDKQNVYFTMDTILYRIYSNPQEVEPVYSAKTPIKDVIFEEHKIILLEAEKYHVVNKNFDLIEIIDLSSLSDVRFSDYVWLYNRSSYIKGYGFVYNFSNYDLELEHGAFFTEKTTDNFKELSATLGFDGTKHVLGNVSNNIMAVISPQGTFSGIAYLFDLKTNSKISTPDNFNVENVRATLEESGDLFSVSYRTKKEEALFSTDRGQTWTKITDKQFYDLCATESGQMYGYNLDEGLFGYDAVTGAWKKIDLPSPLHTKSFSNLKSFFEVEDNIYALYPKTGIIKTVNGLDQWEILSSLPEGADETAALYVEDDKTFYILAANGLFKKEESGDWQLLNSNLPSDDIVNLQFVDISADNILCAVENQSNVLTLYNYDFHQNQFTDLGKNANYVKKAENGNYLYISANEPSILLEFDTDFNLLNSILLPNKFLKNRGIVIANGHIYAATRYGLYRAEDWNSTFQLIGSEDFAINSMMADKNNSVFLSLKGSDDLYFVDDANNTLELLASSSLFENCYLKFITGDGAIITDNIRLGYYELNQTDKISLTYSIDDTYFVDDQQKELLIYPNAKDYRIRIINYSSVKDTVIYPQTDTLRYPIQYLQNQNLRLSFIASKTGMEDFQSELINVNTFERKRNIIIDSRNDQKKMKHENVFLVGQTASYYYSIVPEISSMENSGTITIQNTLNSDNKTIEYDGTNEAIYEFDIPIDTENGIYKLTYSGKTDNSIEIPEAIQYFIVHDEFWDSVEEPNSIITNTNVYPNPAVSNVEVQFEMKEAGDLTCEIYDLNGNKVLSIPTSGYAAGQSNLSFDVSNLVSGQYMIFLKAQDKVTAAKLVISK